MTQVKVHQTGNNTLLINGNKTELDITAMDPSDLMAASLAKCTYKSIINRSKKHGLPAEAFSVRVELIKNSEDKKAEFKVHVQVDARVDEATRAAIEKIARKSYIRRLLALEMYVEGDVQLKGE